jgi:DNA-binding transcriptional MerR regulator
MGRRNLYTLGEVSLATGLSRQTLHTYAVLGLLPPAETTPGGRRLFSARVFRRIEEIRRLKVELTLARIRDLYAPPAGRRRVRGAGEAGRRR